MALLFLALKQYGMWLIKALLKLHQLVYRPLLYATVLSPDGGLKLGPMKLRT